MLQMWVHRNALVHGCTRLEKQKARRRKAIEKVVQMFHRKPQLRSSDDSRYYCLSLSEMLLQSTPQLEAWVTYVLTAEESYSKYGEIRSSLKQCTIS